MPREYDPLRTCRKVECWPAAEKAAWDAALKKGTIFDHGGGGSHWKPTTVTSNAKSYGRWLEWLDRNRMLDPNAGPCQQLTRENVARYVTDLSAQVSTGMVANRLGDLYSVAKVLVPDGEWSWIRAAWYRTRHDARPVKNKIARLVNTRELYRYGLELMDGAERADGGSEFERALRFKDGLTIALLSARPVRRENFASIRIGEHLVRRGPDYWLIFGEHETKTNTELEWPFPSGLVPYLERYVSHHRPALLARYERFGTRFPPAGQHLWISRFGSALTGHGMYGQVALRTKQKFGRSMSPHLFRDAVATTQAIEDPVHVKSCKTLLGHSTEQTAERVYNQARSIEAATAYQTHLQGLRRQRPARRKKRRVA